MNTILQLIIIFVTLCAAIIFISKEVRNIWKNRKKRQELKQLEAKRRLEIKSGAVSESAYHKNIAFQAAVFHANSHIAGGFITLFVALFCLFLAALFHFVGLKTQDAMTWMLVLEFLIIGSVILFLGVFELGDFKTFERDMSSSYRALLTTENPDNDD